MTEEQTSAAGSTTGRRPRWTLAAIAVLWTVLTPFMWGVVSVLVTLAELVVGRGAVNGNLIASAAIEAVVYLGASFGVFRMARGLAAPAWYWPVGPAGYLLGGAGYVLLMMTVGGAIGLWEPIAVILADTACCALGAYAGVRASAGGSDRDAVAAP